MSSFNLAEHQRAVARSSMLEDGFGIFPQFIPLIEKEPNQQKHIFDIYGVTKEQQLAYNNPLQNNGWKLEQGDDELIDPVIFVQDIMKIMKENPKLYDALANDQYES